MTTIRFSRLLGLAVAASLFAGCSSDDTTGLTVPVRTLSVQISGSGTVTSDIGGINCSQAGGSCSATFSNNEAVILTAVPASGFAFRAWAGACTPFASTPTSCSVVVSQDRIVVAIFESTTGGSGGAAFGVTDDRRLFNFNPQTPGSATTPATLTGIPSTETVVGMDFRPQTNVLYAVTRDTATPATGRLYIVNETTSSATFIAELTADAGDATDPYAGLEGTDFGLDFNPITDRIRLVSDTGQSLSINTANAKVTTDTDLDNPGTAAGYTNSFIFTGNTTLYTFSSADNKLYRQAGADGSGTMEEVGLTGIVVTGGENGFDIDGANGTAVLVATVAAERRVYTVNLSTGAATLRGSLPVTTDVRGVALKAPKAPEVFGVKETTPQVLVRFSPSSPSSVTDIGAITGLQGGETIRAIAFRQSDGTLFGLGIVDNGANKVANVYTLDVVTAAATLTAATAFTLSDSGNFGAAFDPTSLLMRIVSSGDAAAPANNDNIAVDVTAGTVDTDADLQREPFDVTGAAYDTAPDDATLYVIDSTGDRLMTLNDDPGAQGNGRLTAIGGLGVDVDAVNGFLLVGDANIAFLASKATATTSILYSVNLGTGPAAEVGTIGIAEVVTGLAMPASANPSTTAEIWATTSTNRLISFARNNPGTLTSNRVIVNLNGNVVGLEFRPDSATSVFALTDTNQICSVVLLTATASCSPLRQVNPPPNPPSTYDLQGTSFGFDFDQSQLVWRIVSDADENLVVDPATLSVTEDVAINDDVPLFIQAAAHTSNFAGALSTSLYVIDSVNNADAADRNARLKIVPNPAAGVVFDVGSLTVRSDAQPVSMDILGGHDGLALVALRTNANAFSTLYRINLSTGQATSVGNIGPAPPPPGPPVGAETRITVGSMALRFQP